MITVHHMSTYIARLRGVQLLQFAESYGRRVLVAVQLYQLSLVGSHVMFLGD